MVKLEVVQAKNGQWYPRIKGGNNERWYTGETHRRKADAKRSLKRLIDAIRADLVPILVQIEYGNINEIPK